MKWFYQKALRDWSETGQFLRYLVSSLSYNQWLMHLVLNIWERIWFISINLGWFFKFRLPWIPGLFYPFMLPCMWMLNMEKGREGTNGSEDGFAFWIAAVLLKGLRSWTPQSLGSYSLCCSPRLFRFWLWKGRKMNNEYIAIFFIYFSEKFEFVFLLLKPGLDGFFCTLNPFVYCSVTR